MGLKIGYHHLEIIIFPNGNGYNKCSIKPIWGIRLIYPRGSNSEHKPGAQNEHQPNAENKGLIWWYDTGKFLYQNQTMDQVDTMNM